MRPDALLRGAILMAVLAACSARKPDDSLDSIRDFSSTNLWLGKDGGSPGCKAMLDSYCDYLYAPENLGNLKLRKGKEPHLYVLQGHTKNDFPLSYYQYAHAKLRTKDRLPRDFRKALEVRGYFSRLRSFLARRPREKMAFGERLQSLRTEYALEQMWDGALDETVLLRMESRFGGYFRMKDPFIPIELQIERRRVRRNLISEISRSIWKSHPNWIQVERGFQSLQEHFVTVIGRLDLPSEIRQRWMQRLRSVRLVPPGSLPEISDEECSATTANAFYYTHLNILTVCAGDFNTEDILETMAHELAHSLDVARAGYLFQRESKIGRSLLELRDEVCSPKTFTCTAWNRFQSKFVTDLDDLRNFKPELPEFQRCLKRRPTEKSLGDDDIARLATVTIRDRMADLADSDIFLRITKSQIPLPNGHMEDNPNFQNPCGYYLWSRGEEPIDDEISTLLFFTAEYRCREGQPKDRLREALAKAKTMSEMLASESIRMEGEFSSRKLLEIEGYASSPAERFADVVGSYALADHLSGMSSIHDRRNVFLASSSWQCSKPSLAGKFPEESAVQREYALGMHTDGDDRKKEFFSKPLRESLGCRQDFEFDACELDLAPSR